MEIIKIKTPFIQLQQLLKFADVVEEGAVFFLKKSRTSRRL